MNTHIDTLAQWYADAERITVTSLPRVGDTLIFPYNADGYAIDAEGDDWTPADIMPGESARILHRAPKPKPAWHDAAAVVAVTPGRPERRVFIRYDEPGWWGDVDSSYETDELAHVTPLIEAKVTDEMIDRILDVIAARFDNYPAGIGEEIAAAALGLETE